MRDAEVGLPDSQVFKRKRPASDKVGLGYAQPSVSSRENSAHGQTSPRQFGGGISNK